MKHGFIKVAALTPEIKVADPVHNAASICEMLDRAEAAGARVMVFPELCITGYSCGDLFFQDLLLKGAKDALLAIANHTEGKGYLAIVGLPLEYNGKLYNVAAAVGNGYVYGLVPKTNLPNYREFSEVRHFAPALEETVSVDLNEEYTAPMGTRLLFGTTAMPGLKVAVEICEDMWVAQSPAIMHAKAGANLIVNPAAHIELPGRADLRLDLVRINSMKYVCGYVLSNPGVYESTQDVVCTGQKIIAENGTILSASRFVDENVIYSEVDITSIVEERRRMNTFTVDSTGYLLVDVDMACTDTELTRHVSQSPFIPAEGIERDRCCEETLLIQSYGLKRRLEHTHSQTAVVGISGGLDSTLALLVTAKAFDLLGKDRADIIAITMPGFGTTDRTYDNAVSMIKSVGATFKEISIKDAVSVHFNDIEHDPQNHNVTYENAQARERTQILMDVANMNNGLVIGTGDLSELVLGWATYNGDHMSNYSVNGSIPKTMVRHLVKYYADTCGDAALKTVLYDVLDTPVSPELLPPDAGKIAQKTEDLVGPYELHDFFLYYVLRYGFEPKKIYRLANYAFAGDYDEETILKWLKTFYRRFFTQQFKRSCLPDGPKAGPVGVSPRGDLSMPSDAHASMWLAELDQIQN
ncbi:MAG: NAD(+) synthase [Eubacterium sp.]|nr:NAD(+) synthase [Eubacterium sp.]